MKEIMHALNLVFGFLINFQLLLADASSNNDRPIIGIVSVGITDEVLIKRNPELYRQSYIATSYVKFIEMAGARVVPISLEITKEKLKLIFNSINGLLFPGGEINLQNSRYYHLTKKLYDMAVERNEAGEYFPVLGICRGMQALMVHAQGDISPLTLTDSVNYTASLRWTPKSLYSTLFKYAPDELFTMAEGSKITSHFHKFGVTPATYLKMPKLRKLFKVLACSFDRKGVYFISIIEGRSNNII